LRHVITIAEGSNTCRGISDSYEIANCVDPNVNDAADIASNSRSRSFSWNAGLTRLRNRNYVKLFGMSAPRAYITGNRMILQQILDTKLATSKLNIALKASNLDHPRPLLSMGRKSTNFGRRRKIPDLKLESSLFFACLQRVVAAVSVPKK
jgi:hypothetical protein